MNQITLFEPTGDELATLAASTFNHAENLQKQSDLLSLRGFLAAARSYAVKANDAFERSFVFEMAFQFEIEAEL